MISTKKLKPLQAFIVVLILGAVFALDQFIPGTANVVRAEIDPSAVVVGVITIVGVGTYVIRGDGTATRKDDKGPIK